MISVNQILAMIDEWDRSRLQIFGGYPSTVRFIPGYVIVAQENEDDSPSLFVMPLSACCDLIEAELEYRKSPNYKPDFWHDVFPFDCESGESHVELPLYQEWAVKIADRADDSLKQKLTDGQLTLAQAIIALQGE